MKVTALQHVSLVVSDTLRALEFYHEMLGFPLNEQRPDLPFPGAWLDIGDLQIHLIENEIQKGASHSATVVGRDRHIAFSIDSIEELKQTLTGAGIPFVESQRRPALFCRDPDGNGLEFIGD